MIDRDDPTIAPDVLLVESAPDVGTITKRTFENGSTPATVHVVADGAECLDFLSQRGEYADAPEPNLIVLQTDPFQSVEIDDADGSSTNGGSLLEAISDSRFRRIPVIVCLEPGATQDAIRRCYDHRANAVVVTPPDDEAVADYMEHVERFWIEAARLPNRAGGPE